MTDLYGSLDFCVRKPYFDDVLSWILRYRPAVLHVTITMTQWLFWFHSGCKIFSISKALDTKSRPLVVPSSSADVDVQACRLAQTYVHPTSYALVLVFLSSSGDGRRITGPITVSTSSLRRIKIEPSSLVLIYLHIPFYTIESPPHPLEPTKLYL